MVSLFKKISLFLFAMTICSLGNALPIDYTSLTHTISVKSLRAGNHDKSGENKYYFEAELVSLIHKDEELALEYDKRKKKVVSLGKFGEITIKPLAHWSQKDSLNTLRIKGEQIRKLTADTMQEFSVSEDNITILVNIFLKEEDKKYFGFYGEDQNIIKEDYYPIPPAFLRTADTKDKVVTLKDDLGTFIELSINFDKNKEKK